jgi:hypothetical protein
MGLLFGIGRAAIQGLVAYITPRLLILLGVPLDRWIVAMSEYLTPAVANTDDAVLVAFLLSFVLLVIIEMRWQPAGKALTFLSGIRPYTAKRPSVSVALSDSATEIGGYPVLCALEIENIDPEGASFKDSGLVQIDEINVTRPSGMPLPFVLRTDAQTRDRRSGRWNLSHRQRKVVPVLFQGPTRKDQWWFIDERGNRHMISPKDMRMLVGIYDLGKTVRGLIKIEKDDNWDARPSIEIVPDDYRWETSPDQSAFTQELARPKQDLSANEAAQTRTVEAVVNDATTIEFLPISILPAYDLGCEKRAKRLPSGVMSDVLVFDAAVEQSANWTHSFKANLDGYSQVSSPVVAS